MPKLKKKVSRDFTTIHNAMVRDRNLGATERGVLLTMLSLPDSWDFSIKGLTAILPDGYTKISTALKKLEKAGYLIRERIYSDGKICDWEYTFSDEPMISQNIESVEDDIIFCLQESEKQETENLIQGSQKLEKRCTNKINNNQIKNNQVFMNQISINQSETDGGKIVENHNDNLTDENIREIIKTNIEYDEYSEWITSFADGYMTVNELDDIVGIIVRTIKSCNPVERICGHDFPRETIKSAMFSIDRTCIEHAIETMKRTDNIRNHERYLISTLFNEANNKHFRSNSETRNVNYAIQRDFGGLYN